MIELGYLKLHWMDGLSIGTIAATIIGWLPHVAVALSIAWYIALFYDRRKAKKREEQLEASKAKIHESSSPEEPDEKSRGQ